LNLYSGIGGNRTLWGESHSITSVEFDPSIANIYSQRFPNDTLIIGDALDYLLNNYLEFDFIWCSPPCPTHSIARHFEPKFLDCSLWMIIQFLQKYLPEDKFFCVENVVPYYEPFIQPSGTINRHCFWTNYDISQIKFSPFIPTYENVGTRTLSLWYNHLGFSLSDIDTSGVSKIKVLRNCVHPKVGLLLLARILKPLQTLEDFL
jgi:DNA (cytosine-5)-methyltransferase 1